MQTPPRASAPHPDELTWPARIRAGEHRAFEAMFQAYYAMLCNAVLVYVKSRDVAEDLVQDLFTYIWDHHEEWGCVGSPRAYLLTSVRRRALDHIRAGRVRAQYRETELARQQSPADASVSRPADRVLELKELEAQVEAVLATLPPRMREAFRLTWQLDMSYEEAGAVMNISPRTVGVHVGRSLVALRRALAPFVALLFALVRF